MCVVTYTGPSGFEGDVGASMMSEVLKTNTKLTSLDLSSDEIDDAD